MNIILKERIKRGLTQKELMELIKKETGATIHPYLFSRWENNLIMPSAKNINILASFFKKPIEEVFEELQKTFQERK